MKSNREEKIEQLKAITSGKLSLSDLRPKTFKIEFKVYDDSNEIYSYQSKKNITEKEKQKEIQEYNPELVITRRIITSLPINKGKDW